MNFLVKDEILNAIANYLASRPYSEVAGLIKALQDGAKPHEEIKHEEVASLDA